MADLQKIRERIREIAGRRHNVRLSEIEWVVNQLRSNGFRTNARDNGHQKLFLTIKACYVDAFLEAMIDLELYEED